MSAKCLVSAKDAEQHRLTVLDSHPFAEQIRGFGLQLAQQQAQEVEVCLYCTGPCVFTDDLPYCSIECAARARGEGA